MRIDAFNKISQLYGASNIKSTSKAKGTSFSDKLEISQTGKDYQAAKQIIARTPDVREDKLNEIKQRMEAGAYNINMRTVADKLVDQYFDETL
ncbi:flagellar biosynthesis anti-sigma factor FlgM [Mobilitalea sibirica]|uniref:Negative regulator of flagellin synthesis n=1 Tax=Mobilitalea sibirica TaxID=1462919 RepID=A0A8J7H193_9FIRM|nr:flagellar biosynthesis anti-sigma factor FlgM [Mobilitalea sibirica]MBH1942459.1 flagellar biosynthesis anti-sigma factor FlgM [Mobilitalea sibirica]